MKIFDRFKKKKKIEKKDEMWGGLEDLSEAQRMAEVDAIRDTLGYKVIMDDARILSDDVRDVSVLGANYGNKRIDKQLGTLGGAGLIASHIINSFIESYEQE